MDARAFVFERGAQRRRGPSSGREGFGGDSDGSLDALDGERELFVAAQRDDEGPRLFVMRRLDVRRFDAQRLAAARSTSFGPVRGVRFDLGVDECERVEDGAHAPAHADDA